MDEEEEQRYLFLVERAKKPVSFIGRQWNCYSQFIVCCKTVIDAQNTHPSGTEVKPESWYIEWIDYNERHGNLLDVKCLGVALETTEDGVIMAKMMT
jgi:hypothetical protein